MRQDTKLIPTKIVNRKLKERIDALIAAGMRERVTRKEKQTMKDQLIVEMAATAEYETTQNPCTIRPEKRAAVPQHHYQAPAQGGHAPAVKCMGSLKTRPSTSTTSRWGSATA
ncbi:recombination-associated protein RdgC [Aeromonas salmonicida]|uniref:recombination-associated protein RdgC n=1 Tax=Aeromonas salmonicida TaxID=645 RepID=UPI00155936DE